MDAAASITSAAPFPLRIQTDTFCDRCGYNLFSQNVWVDERLDIPITQCPECGRYHAAGSADTLWTHRLTVFLDAVRVLGTLAIIGWQIGWKVVAMLFWLNTHTVSWLYKVPQRYLLVCWPWRDVPALEWVFLIGNGVLAGWSFGAFFMITMWHWQRRRLKLLAFVPYVVAALTWIAWYPPSLRDGEVLAASMTWFASFEALGVMLGFYFARPVARLAIWTVLPPRYWGELVYLWHIDGLTPPHPELSKTCRASPHSSATPTISSVVSGSRSVWASASALRCDTIIDNACSWRV